MQISVSEEFLKKIEKAGLLEELYKEQKLAALQKKIKDANFPYVKTFADFEFERQPTIKKNAEQ